MNFTIVSILVLLLRKALSSFSCVMEESHARSSWLPVDLLMCSVSTPVYGLLYCLF